MKKNLLIAMCILTATMTFTTNAKETNANTEYSLEFYNQLIEDLDIIEIYDSSELTIEDLQNRNGKIIIEKCIGVVTDENGSGRILNYQDPNYYYISYENVKDFSVDDIILTYFIYNPDTNYEDDIISRYDYIIDDK